MNHNALVDPDVYRPLPEVGKRYDAVYDARVNPFKRHHLASRIDKLALLAARWPHFHDEAYVRSVHAQIPHAHWYNDPLAADYRSLGPEEVNRCLNECRVGLCLSAREGAMFASIQYLLAGLPVISTTSQGGRDVFFDPDYTCIVADDPEAVAEGVDRMRSCPVPAGEIRARTLDRMTEHLDRLFTLLDDITRTAGRPVDLRPGLREWGAGKGPGHTQPASILDRIRRCRDTAVPGRQVSGPSGCSVRASG